MSKISKGQSFKAKVSEDEKDFLFSLIVVILNIAFLTQNNNKDQTLQLCLLILLFIFSLPCSVAWACVAANSSKSS